MEAIERLYFRYFPEKLLGEILTKRWSDNAVPVLATILTIGFSSFRTQTFSRCQA